MTEKHRGIIFFDPEIVQVQDLESLLDDYRIVPVPGGGAVPTFYPPRNRKRLHWGKRFQGRAT